MARTSGEASSNRRSAVRAKLASPLLPMAMRTLRRKRSRPVRLMGEPAKRSEEHTSELQSLMRISYAGFCLKKKNKNNKKHTHKHNKHTSQELINSLTYRQNN